MARMTGKQTRSILVVEDDPGTADTIALYLRNEGFEPIIATDGDAGLRLARSDAFSLIVLDLNLPRRDGTEICRSLRKESKVPIIMVTARTTESDRIAGLDLGADDYVSKPFSPRELMARIRAALRRSDEPGDGTKPPLLRGPMTIDGEKRRVTLEDAPIDLTHHEHELLTVLAERPGKVWSRERLAERLFDDPWSRDLRTIDAHIKNLRAKIESDRRNPRWIQTVFGSGYRFTIPDEETS